VKITLQVQRYNPEQDAQPTLQEYKLEVEPTDRVLDALMSVKEKLDGTLAFRRSCAHGVCGSDAMIINGQERLACKTLVQDVAESDGATITVAPLKHMPLLRDLIVDQDEFFDRWRSVKPFLIAGEAIADQETADQASDKELVERREHIQSQKERAAFDDPTKCILCAACYSACPILDGENLRFLGPAALAQAARFVFDSRDQGFEERLEILDHPDGVWACNNHFQCTRVCPRGIKVTKNINLTKRKIRQERQPDES
jgi:succinate dehydrogenase / fumarate reductase iron-sulfur subunit